MAFRQAVPALSFSLRIIPGLSPKDAVFDPPLPLQIAADSTLPAFRLQVHAESGAALPMEGFYVSLRLPSPIARRSLEETIEGQVDADDPTVMNFAARPVHPCPFDILVPSWADAMQAPTNAGVWVVSVMREQRQVPSLPPNLAVLPGTPSLYVAEGEPLDTATAAHPVLARRLVLGLRDQCVPARISRRRLGSDIVCTQVWQYCRRLAWAALPACDPHDRAGRVRKPASCCGGTAATASCLRL